MEGGREDGGEGGRKEGWEERREEGTGGMRGVGDGGRSVENEKDVLVVVGMGGPVWGWEKETEVDSLHHREWVGCLFREREREGEGERERGREKGEREREYLLLDSRRFCLIAASMGPGLAHSILSMAMNQRMQQSRQPSTAILPSHATLGRRRRGKGRVKMRALQNYVIKGEQTRVSGGGCVYI